MAGDIPAARNDYDRIVDGLIARIGNMHSDIEEYLLNPARLLREFGTDETMRTQPEFFAAIMRLSRGESSPVTREGNIVAPAWPMRRPR